MTASMTSPRMAGAFPEPEGDQTVTTIDTTDLGTTVCRALLREMDDKPIALEPYRQAVEYTTEARKRVALQWSVMLRPMLDGVTVRAQTRYRGLGLWDYARINPAGRVEETLFVDFPEDPADIIGEEYTAELRAAIETAVKAVEDDYAAAKAGRA
jgi:hypothetical protein